LPLDEGRFRHDAQALCQRPDDEALAEAIEQQARDADVWARAAEVFLDAARYAEDVDGQLNLTFRAARIYELDAKDPLRAEAAYQRILELEPSNEVALRGLENSKRSQRDFNGLIGLLLDRVENETSPEARAETLAEVAGLYERELRDGENACIAWVQALAADPSHDKAWQQVQRLAGNDAARWAEVVESLGSAVQSAHADLQAEPGSELTEAQQAVTEAAMALEAARQAAEAEEAGRRQLSAHAGVRAAASVQRAQETYDATEADVRELTAQLDEANQQLQMSELVILEKAEAADRLHAEAEAKVQAFEQTEELANVEPSEALAEQLEILAAEAEALVEQASQLSAEVEAAREEIESTRGSTMLLASDLDEAKQALAAAEASLMDARMGAVTPRCCKPTPRCTTRRHACKRCQVKTRSHARRSASATCRAW
jgi:hypothetical protein